MSFHLYILRHAKSDWSAPGTSDFDRPLNKRGRENAKSLGKWMRDNAYIPQQIVSSPAMRARQTTEVVTSQFKKHKPEKILFEDRLYLADLDTLLECINDYKHGLKSLMLVAHNPGLDQLVYQLGKDSIQTDANGKTMTTAALAIFKYSNAEFDPEYKKGEVLEFIRPKELD